MQQSARGVRNHNPLNIEWTDEYTWLGIAAPPHDGRFCVFLDAFYGIRASVKTLQTYAEEHNCKTVRDFITRWCPPERSANDPEGNDTEAYIEQVWSITGMAGHTRLYMEDYDQVLALVKAMATVECGGLPDYPAEVWEKGLRMAGLVRTRPVEKSRTGAGVAGVATGATAVLINAARDTMPGLELFLPEILADLPRQYIYIAAFLVIAASNSLTLYARWDDYRQGRR